MSFHAQAAHEKKGPLRPFSYEPEPLRPHDVEIAITSGMARPSAWGQAMTRTVAVRTSASSG